MKGKLSNENLILEEIPEAERLLNSLSGSASLIDEEDDPDQEDILFTVQMRNATKAVHNVSDALVNAKVGLGMTSMFNKV